MPRPKKKNIPNQQLLFPEEEEVVVEPVVIQRDVTIDRLTEYYYDLVEMFKNGDGRVKATDCIKALSEIGRINKLYDIQQAPVETNISFTLG